MTSLRLCHLLFSSSFQESLAESGEISAAAGARGAPAERRRKSQSEKLLPPVLITKTWNLGLPDHGAQETNIVLTHVGDAALGGVTVRVYLAYLG